MSKVELRKELGKISSVSYGYGGYQDAQFGWWFTFSTGPCSRVGTGKGFWTSEPDNHTEWSKEDQVRLHGETTMELIEIMKKAKVTEIHQLDGIPVELEFDVNELKNWRVLEEVL